MSDYTSYADGKIHTRLEEGCARFEFLPRAAACTDIDLATELGKCFFMGEIKPHGATIRTGQRLMFEAMQSQMPAYRHVWALICGNCRDKEWDVSFWSATWRGQDGREHSVSGEDAQSFADFHSAWFNAASQVKVRGQLNPMIQFLRSKE